MCDCRNCTYYNTFTACDTHIDWCEFANDEIPDVSTGDCDFYVSVDGNLS